MARMHHLLLTLASGSAFYSGLVPALGLGEISLHSALNQPLDAEIELLQVGDLSSDELKVRLASAEEFRRVGVERFYFLNDLRFVPVLGGGRNLIRVVSSQPVREPYLNFIVEVNRPGGQLLREFTLLIDPPGSVAASAYATAAQPEPQARPMPEARSAWLPEPARAQPAANRGERYRVQRGDSLWRIAGRLLPPGGSREDLMADIFVLNPQAFSGGSPDRLRADAELLLPDVVRGEPAVAATAASEPVTAPVLADTAPPAVVQDMAAAQVDTAAQAAPVVPDEAAQVAQSEAQLQAIQAQQTQADTELAEASAQNRELHSALGGLQAQMAQLQAQMAEKDHQLQQIRADLQQRQVEAAPAPVEAPEPVAQRGWEWWQLGGLMGLALVAGVLLGRRRQAPRAAEPEQRMPLPEPRPEVRIISRPQQDKGESAAAMSAPRQPAAVADPLEGANLYIAYGHFSEAANTLRQALQQHPERLDLRLRLLEVYGELGDASAFVELAQQLRDMGASPAQLDQLLARYAGLQRAQEQAPLADAVLQLDEPAGGGETLATDDFQLNLDDLSLDADWSEISPFQPDRPQRLRNTQAAAQFDSDLQQLPEVLEVDADKELLESFAELPQEQVLEDELTDTFAPDPAARSTVTSFKARAQDSDLDHLGGNRDHLAKLNMALAYIEQGDIGSACDILNEVISEGDEQQRQRARELLAKIA